MISDKTIEKFNLNGLPNLLVLKFALGQTIEGQVQITDLNIFNYYRPISGLKRNPRFFASRLYTNAASLPMYGVHLRGPIEGSIKQNQYSFLLIKMRDPHDTAATSKLIS